jgi:type IV secretory pathway TrbF-like protein
MVFNMVIYMLKHARCNGRHAPVDSASVPPLHTPYLDARTRFDSEFGEVAMT